MTRREDQGYPHGNDRLRQHWLLAAGLFIGGGLGAIAPDALHKPEHPPTIFLLPLLALLSGLVCWAVSSRASARWLHVVLAIATLEVALTVALADREFAAYYTFIAIFAAYVFDRRSEIAAHVGFACLMTLAPILYDFGDARDGVLTALILVPSLLLSAGAVAFLRERLEASERRYRELSELDPLTEVGNYRMLANRLDEELRRHHRYKRQMAVIALDLDGFKAVNDELGHQRGDSVLREVAERLTGTVRGSDHVARQGGDEFCVLAPELNRDAADELAQRMCAAVGSIELEEGRLGACTGVAVFPRDGQTAERLLAHADEELRAAKRSKGREFVR